MPKITKLDSSSPEFEKVKKKLFRYWISIIKNEKKNKKKKIIMFPTPISVHVFRVINKEVATAFWEKVKKIEKKEKHTKENCFMEQPDANHANCTRRNCVQAGATYVVLLALDIPSTSLPQRVT